MHERTPRVWSPSDRPCVDHDGATPRDQRRRRPRRPRVRFLSTGPGQAPELDRSLSLLFRGAFFWGSVDGSHGFRRSSDILLSGWVGRLQRGNGTLWTETVAQRGHLNFGLSILFFFVCFDLKPVYKINKWQVINHLFCISSRCCLDTLICLSINMFRLQY
jgi:hypothetical protein